MACQKVELRASIWSSSGGPLPHVHGSTRWWGRARGFTFSGSWIGKLSRGLSWDGVGDTSWNFQRRAISSSLNRGGMCDTEGCSCLVSNGLTSWVRHRLCQFLKNIVIVTCCQCPVSSDWSDFILSSSWESINYPSLSSRAVIFRPKVNTTTAMSGT